MRVQPISILVPSDSAKADIAKHVFDAKFSFAEMRTQGHYRQLSNQMLVYRITDADRSFTGIVLGIDINEFIGDTIVHHERTISSKVANQTAVAKGQGGFSKPILLTTRAIPAVTDIINRYTIQQPLLDVHLKKYSARHQVWPIDDNRDVDIIINSFAKKGQAYIVDGHHRTRAIEALSRDKDVSIPSGLCAMFDIDQLDILPFHRIVELDISKDKLLSELRNIGTVDKLSKSQFPNASGEIILLFNGSAYSFRWKEKPASAIEALDVNLLSKLILKDILHIRKESSSSKVAYLEGNYSLTTIRSKIKGNSKVAFLLHPISREAFISTVNTGHLLPPKSTWFLPRMANGIVSMEF